MWPSPVAPRPGDCSDSLRYLSYGGGAIRSTEREAGGFLEGARGDQIQCVGWWVWYTPADRPLPRAARGS